ncbi:hypothetical protein [Candidatus Tisiphia endosymbiont of Mystacides longicornis]|uniref:hypothetical protein n=1 Tax=Candidatus Tisiphia endosymbiont of Mystacides longicornis TaxID=3139330 RepID=UPI003CCB5350
MTSCTLTFLREHSRNSSLISIHATMPLRMMDDYKTQENLKAYCNLTINLL